MQVVPSAMRLHQHVRLSLFESAHQNLKAQVTVSITEVVISVGCYLRVSQKGHLVHRSNL